MKIVLQRVKEASVTVEKEKTGAIDHGLLLLVGIHREDTEEQLEWICNKILNLRVFDDEEGRMNYSVTDVQGGLLVVSQFTLYGNVQKGNRPGYSQAAPPDEAEAVYNKVIRYLKENSGLDIQTGRFGAHMDVYLINDGPVTIILEK